MNTQKNNKLQYFINNKLPENYFNLIIGGEKKIGVKAEEDIE